MKNYHDTKNIIDQHKQLFTFSCIPSAVEMILKLEGKVNSAYYEHQMEWKNNKYGSFQNINGLETHGLIFNHQFPNSRGKHFSYISLYATIDNELELGRYVAIALPSGCEKNEPSENYHNFIIFRKNVDDNYDALSKEGPNTISLNDVKKWVEYLNGTDILTYIFRDESIIC